jgi:hypothetical protein
VYFYIILINIGQYFYVTKNTKSDMIILGFHQNFQKYKKKLKIEKNVYVHTTKCLKAKKKSYCVFHTPKNNVLACILTLITSLLKSREH